MIELSDAGDVFMCMDQPLPAILEEDEALSYAGDLLTCVYGEAAKARARVEKEKARAKASAS